MRNKGRTELKSNESQSFDYFCKVQKKNFESLQFMQCMTDLNSNSIFLSPTNPLEIFKIIEGMKFKKVGFDSNDNN